MRYAAFGACSLSHGRGIHAYCPGNSPGTGVDALEYLDDVLAWLAGQIRSIDLPALLLSRWAAAAAAATAPIRARRRRG